MQVQLVLVRFGHVQHLYVTALHAHSQPLACGTVAQREDLQTGRRRRTLNHIPPVRERSRPGFNPVYGPAR